MNTLPATGLLHFLQEVPDPRGRQGQRHPHTAMLAVVVCAMLCNFQGYDAIAQWIRILPLQLWHSLGGKRRPPCANTFRDLMNIINPEILERALWRWVTEGLGLQLQAQDLSGVIIDGKVLRGTKCDHRRTRQILAALDQQTGCVLSETEVSAETNEAKTAIEFLKRLVLQGQIVAGDAGFCHREVCETILSEHGEYLILVKDNQPTLLKEAVSSFIVPKDFSPLPQTASV